MSMILSNIYLTDILKAKMLPEQLDSGVQLMAKKSEGMFLYAN